MLRLPSFAEIGALFTKHRTVASATSAITGTVQRLDDVVQHHTEQADTKSADAADLESQAAVLHTEVTVHEAEAYKAVSVAAKLSALLS